MVKKCCVHKLCRCDPTLSKHSFPSDDTRRQLWAAKVPLHNWSPSKTSKICSAHFNEDAYKTGREDSNLSRCEKKGNDLSGRKILKDDAIPTIWPNCPEYLTKISPPKRLSRNSTGERSFIEESSLEVDGRENPLSLYALQGQIDASRLPESVCYIRKENQILLLSVLFDDGQPQIRFSIVIQESLEYKIWVNGLEVKSDLIPSELSTDQLITSCNQLYSIVNYLDQNNEINSTYKSVIEIVLKKLDELSSNKKIEFIKEQLSLLGSMPNGRRYANSLLATAVLWQNVSPACYRQILADGVLTLPSVRHVRRLSSALNVDLELTESTVAYLTARKSKLATKDLLINVVIDEVHCLQCVQYSDGKFYGMENNQSTKTLLVVMIRSIAGRYRDVVCMSPTHNINQEKILKVWIEVVQHVTTIGYDVVATMTDGHASNVSFYASLVKGSQLNSNESIIQNTFHLQHLILLLFDTVHIFKNFYNNFLNYKVLDFPEFIVGGDTVVLQAKFSDIVDLYELEISKPERMAYKLNKKMLYPTSIEKTSVSLANACFHECTINALRYYSTKGHPSFKNTAAFLQIIRNWFNVVNVKSQFSGQKSKDERRDAVPFCDRHQLDFLREFYSWLDRWSELDGRGLSKQTFHHAKVTTINLDHLANYLLDVKGLDYVLFGLIQSDCLEGRFGWDRQLCGGNYFNSVLQFVQAEKKIRLKSLVKMGFLMCEIHEIFQNCNDATKTAIKKSTDQILQKISNFDFERKFNVCNSDEAIVRSLLRKNKCASCVTMLTCNNEPLQIETADFIQPNEQEYLSLCNRGGLIKPSDLVFISCVHAWSMYSFLLEDKTLSQLLLSSPNPRSVFVLLFISEMQRSACTEVLITQSCQSGCLFKDKLEQIAVATFNIKAKNYISAAKDSMRPLQKRQGNHKESKNAKKAKKLSSS